MFTPTNSGPEQIRRNRRVTAVVVSFSVLISLGIVALYLALSLL